MKSKVKSLVNLNVNPCKMCMPMGATTALYGIKECMTILHGSQGCATYIRRHMATHFNEPIDIASSSLTEEGTVYGGHKNLKKGLLNLISLYHPKVIGIMTTCLAETIGEDIEGITDDFYEENPEFKDITIIPVHSPGYSGTQYEGYMAALCAIAGKLEMDTTPNDKVNVILPPHSPADLRFIKQEFAHFGIDAIFLPDNSENLDGGFEKQYSRLPLGGTSIEELKKMAGARLTIEMTDVDGMLSPGKILEDKYQVPFKQIHSPIGLRAIDEFYQTLKEISGKEVPDGIQQQRSRYLDGMIDSHKYNSSGRAVIFGEPEFIIATVKLCEENGIMPVVVATGSVFPNLSQYVKPILDDMAKQYFVDEYIIGDDVDFKEIEEFAIKTGANLMIGSSDGRRIEEHLEIPLVRRAFPIHDRVGGQRLKMLGFEGSLTYLDEITNAVLSKTETAFREEAYDKYYKGSVMEQKKQEKAATNNSIAAEGETDMTDMTEIERKTKEHPCYTCGEHKYARIHLPVAPSCNVQCNYCVRKYDCVNESRPGVTSTVLTPEAGFERYKAVKEKMPNLTVVGIAGPGDACGESFPQVKKTLELIKEYDPQVTFCVSTNGLMLPQRVDELVELGVSHLTVTMNAVDPEIAGKIYKYINYMGERYEGTAAGAILLSNQLSGLKMLVDRGIICKVNIVTLKGINDEHIPDVVQKCHDMGIFMTNIMQMIPVKDSAFENLPMVSMKEITAIRKDCESIMKQMYHCKQCRADAVGTLDNDVSVDLKAFFEKEKAKEKAGEAIKFAVASKSGINVDLHFGKAEEFYIYSFENEEVRFIEKRNINKFCSGEDECGDHDNKIAKIVAAIEDCKVVLAMRIGESPKVKLSDKGIQAVSTFANIETAIHETATKFI